LDFLASVEGALVQGLSESHIGVIDGHDFGGGTGNIFVWAKGNGHRAFKVIKTQLELHKVLDKAVIATWRSKSDHYKVLWPADFCGSFELMYLPPVGSK
jgi:hypothetical protein